MEDAGMLEMVFRSMLFCAAGVVGVGTVVCSGLGRVESIFL
jgi:hypothetical protein